MTTAYDIVHALHRMAAWLTVAAVLLSPAEIAARWVTCRTACPCEQPDSHASDKSKGRSVAQVNAPGGFVSGSDDGCAHEEAGTHSEQCPDDCQNCKCGVGSGVAILMRPAELGCGERPWSPVHLVGPRDAPQLGLRDAVFRPPRIVA